MKNYLHSVMYLLLVTLIALSGTSSQGAAQSAACADTATPDATPASENVVAESVEFDSGSGLLWLGGPRGVLLLHGAAYDAASWEIQAQILISRGYTVFAVEELDASVIADGANLLLEMCGVTGYAVVGASAGGAAGLTYLSDNPQGVTGLILLGATGDVSALEDYPKLFVASEDEGLADQVTNLPSNAVGDSNEVLILPGADHAQAIFTGEQGDTLIEAMLMFLDETVTWEEVPA